MAERMIPVPESLIERAERFDRRGGLGSEVHAWLRELHALLSQPEPSAEPEPFCDSCGGPYDDGWLAMYGRHWDTCPNRVVTPSANTVRTANGIGADHLIESAERILGVPLEPWQMRLCRRVFGGNVGRSTGRLDPEPLSIKQMAPGTTFWARTRDGALSLEVRVWMVCECELVASITGNVLHAERIDPSTIRDVTPPPTTPEDRT